MTCAPPFAISVFTLSQWRFGFVSAYFGLGRLFEIFGFFNKYIPATSNRGKNIAVRIPFFKSPAVMLEMNPTSLGPPEHPRSLAKASRENMAVPPFLTRADALLKLPGHMMPTDNPQAAQPASDMAGDGEREMQRY